MPRLVIPEGGWRTRYVIRNEPRVTTGGQEYSISVGQTWHGAETDFTECVCCHRDMPRRINLWMSRTPVNQSGTYVFMCETCMLNHLFMTGEWENYRE